MSDVFDPKLVESFILEKLSETKLPSIAVAVIEDGRVVYSRAFGFRDAEKLLPATPRTLYGIGSVTKSFTALAIMQLAEEGKLDPHDPITKYVDIRFKPKLGEIEIHHLLTHSSGIPALAYAEAFIDSSVGAGETWLPITRDEDIFVFMDKTVEDWISAKPGERFFYLNEGYVILGKIISNVSGKPYEKYIKDKILKPLKMNRSCFTREEVEELGEWAQPYIIDKDGKLIKSRFPFGITADGGLISTVLDLSNYIIMYLNRGKFDGKRILSEQFIETMTKEHIKMPYEGKPEYYYGYGWIIKNFLGQKLVSHSGSVLVHTAYVGLIPDKNIGVAILANGSGYPLSQIGEYILASMLGQNPEELDFVRRERILKILEGTYHTYKKTMKIEVKRSGDFLLAVEKSRYWEITTILVPEHLDMHRAIFYTISRGRKLPVEFIIEDNKVEMYFERYKLIKTGS